MKLTYKKIRIQKITKLSQLKVMHQVIVQE